MSDEDNGHQPDPETEDDFLDSLGVEPEDEPDDLFEEEDD